jgi:kynurenine formamidase
MRWYREGEAAFRSGSPGIGWEVSQWLKQQHAAFFGSDTPNEEVRPVEPDTPGKTGAPTWHLPIHLEMNRNQGMMLGDHLYLHDLAEDCATDGIYEFMYVGPPLNILHGTGSPVNPQAIK